MSTGRSKENGESKDYNLKDWIISSNLKSSSMNDELCTSARKSARNFWRRKENQQQHHLPGWVSAPQSRSQILGRYSIYESKRDETRRAFTWNTNATKEAWRRRLKLQTQDPGSSPYYSGTSSYYSGSSSIYNVPEIQDHHWYSDYSSSSDGR